MENPDYIVNIPLTEEEILYLREQSKAMQEYFQSNKHLLLSNKWAYNSVTSIEGESDVSKS